MFSLRDNKNPRYPLLSGANLPESELFTGEMSNDSHTTWYFR